MLSAGDIEWIQQFETGSSVFASDVAVSGNVYVTGAVQGTFSGQGAIGISDAFLRAYGPTGAEIWTTRFGDSTSNIGGGKLAVEASGIYMAGAITTVPQGDVQAVVVKYDFNGDELWNRQFFSGAFARDVTADQTGVYVLINSQEGPGLRKYDHSGNTAWTRFLGYGAYGFGDAITVTSSGIYTTGHTF
jgi:hypothetical protein